MEDPISQKLQNEKLSACIQLALNLDNLFKLYSYRIIDTTIFIEDTELEIKKAQDLIQNAIQNATN